MKTKVNLAPNVTTQVEAIQIGETLEVFVGVGLEQAKRRVIQKGLDAGHSITRNDVTEWVTWDAIIDISKRGSEQYTWDGSGDKIKGNLVRHQKRDGETLHFIIKTTYRSFAKWSTT